MKSGIVILSLLVSFTGMSQNFSKVTGNLLTNLPGDSRSVNWVDINHDGFVDCFISNGPSGGQNNTMFINDGAGGFVLLEDDPIVSDGEPSDGATFADIDNDGDLDAFVVNWYNRHNLAYINDGTGHFTRLTQGQWVTNSGFSETAAFGDYDQDGLVDLYVTNSDGISRNFLYRNQNGEIFERIGEGDMVTDQAASRNVNWIDIDADGDVDLFVTNEQGQKEQLYRNDGGGVFEAVSTTALTSGTFSTMSSSWADMDNDGDLDVFLATNGTKNQLYRNDGNMNFIPITDSEVTEKITRSFSCAWADIDNDGDQDLFVTNAFGSSRLKNNLYINDGHGVFSEVTEGALVMDDGWSYGCAFGDYDNDGFQDLAVATTRYGGEDEANYLYHNEGNGHHWIMFSLEGSISNRSAIGTIVRVKAFINGQLIWQMREVSSQSAYCGQNDMRPHFGLGDATIVDSVIIEWPSGIVQYMTNLQVDQIYPVKEEFVNTVEEVSDAMSLSVFPNPTDSNLQISGYADSPFEKLMIKLVRMDGEIVYASEQQISSGNWKLEINLSDSFIVAGTYILHVRQGENEEVRKILLIN